MHRAHSGHGTPSSRFISPGAAGRPVSGGPARRLRLRAGSAAPRRTSSPRAHRHRAPPTARRARAKLPGAGTRTIPRVCRRRQPPDRIARAGRRHAQRPVPARRVTGDLIRLCGGDGRKTGHKRIHVRHPPTRHPGRIRPCHPCIRAFRPPIPASSGTARDAPGCSRFGPPAPTGIIRPIRARGDQPAGLIRVAPPCRARHPARSPCPEFRSPVETHRRPVAKFAGSLPRTEKVVDRLVVNLSSWPLFA